MEHEEAEIIAADLIRALRGRLSRAAFSKRLGYRSNVVVRWEMKSAWPSADTFFTCIGTLRPRVLQVLPRFLDHAATPLPVGAKVSAAEVASFLRELRGKTPLSVLAERAGYSRFRVSRWLQGSARPRLPEFLCMVEAATRRVLDLIALLVDPLHMPTVAPRYRELQVARKVAYDAPWSHAVLRALELSDHPKRHQPTWIAKRLGITVAEVELGLSQLVRGGLARRKGSRYRPTRVQLTDTRADPTRALGLKAHWARTAVDRLEARTPGGFGYSLFSVSKHDLARLRDLHLEYVRAMQTVIAESEHPECVGLYCSQLVDLGEGPEG
jgi:transcriptional regulator with XRE-family HTH domain